MIKMVRSHTSTSKISNSSSSEVSLRLSLLFTCLLVAISTTSTEYSNASYDPADIVGNIEGVTLDKTKLWYLTCNHDSSQMGKSCLLRYRENVFSSASVVKSCTQTNFSPESGRKFGNFAGISPLGADSVIVIWSEITVEQSVIFNFRVVDMNNNCNSGNHEFSFDNDVFKEWFILKSEDSFEVVYDDDKKCEKMCSRTFNKNGSEIVGTKSFSCAYQDCGKSIVPSEINYDFSRATGAFILKSEEQLNAALFFNDNVDQFSHLIRNTPKRAGISTANGYFSFCQRNLVQKNVLHCTRKDLKGWVNLSFDYEPQNSVLYGAPGGKYLLLTSEELKPKDKGHPVSFTFYLTAFNARGIRRNSMVITTLEYHNDRTTLHAHIYTNEKEEFCVTLLDSKRLTVERDPKCFPNLYLFPQHE